MIRRQVVLGEEVGAEYFTLYVGEYKFMVEGLFTNLNGIVDGSVAENLSAVGGPEFGFDWALESLGRGGGEDRDQSAPVN